MEQPYKLILWGYGYLYNSRRLLLQLFQQLGEIEIVAITATELPAYREIDGIRVVPCEKIGELDYDYILLLNKTDFNAIVQHMVRDLGIDRDRILTYRILDMPDFSFRRYCALKESRPTIVANSCWGGFAYRYLGMECLSPFKNLWLTSEDYFRVVQNLKEYAGEYEPVFYNMAEDSRSRMMYPVLALHDVKLHCNHETDPNRAIADWMRRRAKMNFDHVVVEYYSESEKRCAEFMQLKIPYRRICFCARETEIPGVIHIPPREGENALHAVHAEVISAARNLRFSFLELLGGDLRYRSLTGEELDRKGRLANYD